MPRDVKRQGIASTVQLGPEAAQNVSFVPYVDKRWPDQDLEGTLGLHFFKRFSVMTNWDSNTIHMWPRHDITRDVVARLGRWQSKTLAGCEHVACVKVTLIDPLANKAAQGATPPTDPNAAPPSATTPAATTSAPTTPATTTTAPTTTAPTTTAPTAITPTTTAPTTTAPTTTAPTTTAPTTAPALTQHPGLVASIKRDASSSDLPLEVLIAVTPAEGKPPLKWMVVNLPAGAERAMTHLSADYIGATLTVLDASPFPRACPASGGCVDLLAPPQEIRPAPNEPGQSRMVAPSQVKLIVGRKNIPPENLDKHALTGKTIQLSVKVCTDAMGAIFSLQNVQQSGVPEYDAKVMREIRETWRFEPFLVDGKPVPVCATQTFDHTQYGRPRLQQD